jgi:hypothetical protein
MTVVESVASSLIVNAIRAAWRAIAGGEALLHGKPSLAIGAVTSEGQHKVFGVIDLFSVSVRNGGDVDAQVRRADLDVILAGQRVHQLSEHRGMLDGHLVASDDSAALRFKLQSSDWENVQAGLDGPLRVAVRIEYQAPAGEDVWKLRAVRRFDPGRRAFVIDGEDKTEPVQ